MDENGKAESSDDEVTQPLASIRSAPGAFKLAVLAHRAIGHPPREEFESQGIRKSRFMRPPKLRFKKQRSITAKRLPLQEAIKNGNSECIII